MSDFEFVSEADSVNTTTAEVEAIVKATQQYPLIFLSGDYEVELVDAGENVTLLKSGKSTRKRSYEIEVFIIDLVTGAIGPQTADLWLRDAWGRTQDIRKGFSQTTGTVHVRGTGIKGNKVRCGNFSGPSILAYMVTKI